MNLIDDLYHAWFLTQSPILLVEFTTNGDCVWENVFVFWQNNGRCLLSASTLSMLVYRTHECIKHTTHIICTLVLSHNEMCAPMLQSYHESWPLRLLELAPRIMHPPQSESGCFAGVELKIVLPAHMQYMYVYDSNSFRFVIHWFFYFLSDNVKVKKLMASFEDHLQTHQRQLRYLSKQGGFRTSA